jgi:hypothetical protein
MATRAMIPTTEKTPATAPVLWKKLVDDDELDWDPPVGVFAGNVMTEVCVKTWPSDVCRTKEMLEVKEGFTEAEEEAEGVEDVFEETLDEDATLAELDVEALEGVLEDDELLTELEALEGAGGVAVVGVASGVVVGVSLAVVGVIL